MDEVEVTAVKTPPIVKKPFLRRGSGLKRFYKHLDLQNNTRFHQTGVSKVDAPKYLPQVQNFYEPLPVPSVLKSADSPKRNLNVRFSHPSVAVVAKHLRYDDPGSISDNERYDEDKENRRNYHGQTSDDEDSSENSIGEEDWETEDEDEDDDGTDSVVEINESMVEEVFQSILKSNAQRELLPSKTNTTTQVLNDQATGGLERLDLKGQTCPSPIPWKSSFGANLTSSPNSKATERELEMFEKMERFTSNQSFCSTASTVCRFVNTELCISPQPDPGPRQPVPPPQLFKPGPSQPPKPPSPPPPPQVPQLISAPLQPLPPPQFPFPLFKPPVPDVSSQPPIWNPQIELRKEELAQDDEYLRALLTTRIFQLKSQIDTHRTENKRIVQLREFLEKESSDLERSKAEFQIRHSKELEVIDELKRRLKVDQGKVNRELGQARKLKSAGDETESELKNLRDKVLELEKEVKVRSSRWASSARNFKATIEELKTENGKLQKCIGELKADKMKLNARLRKSGKGSGHLPNDLLPTPPEGVNVPAPSATAVAVTFADSVKVGERESKDENGATRIFSPDGQCLEVRYPNGDIKDLRDLDKTGVRKYYFKAADSWEIIHPNGTETLQFGTGEVQTKLPNGVHETKYVSGTLRRVFPDGMEECLFPDKTMIRTGSDGEREIHLPNGQVEYQSKNIKIRIYPDGTEKVLYNNGSALTRYASGRQRFRDPSGQIVYDRLGGDENSAGTVDYPPEGSTTASSSSRIST